MQNKAKANITNSIFNYHLFFNEQDASALYGLHVVIGKIALAAELGLIDLTERNSYVDAIFEQYDILSHVK